MSQLGFNGFRHSISQLDICSHLSNIVSNQTKRPKSSLTGILDLSLDAYQAVKLREQSSKISEIGDALADFEMRLEIFSVYPGERWKDVCISGISIFSCYC